MKNEVEMRDDEVSVEEERNDERMREEREEKERGQKWQNGTDFKKLIIEKRK